jgi:GntR family transcriptional repressor for pyruvate dehydrogenase complex
MQLSAIEPRRLYQAVADQIAQLILANVYRPGERLPPERDLVRQLGVSRPVIREAMIALELAGMVEVRVGSGAYVRRRPDPAAPAQATTTVENAPFDLFQARISLEGEIAAVAAENATAIDFAEMASAVEQMRQAEQDGFSTKPANRRFHLSIATATKNAILVKLFQVLWDELNSRGPLWNKLSERRRLRPTRVAEHDLVMRAIASADPARARAAMRAHVQAAMSDYLEGAAIDPAEPGQESLRAMQEKLKDYE